MVRVTKLRYARFVSGRTHAKNTILRIVLASQVVYSAHVGGSCIEAGVEVAGWKLKAKGDQPQQPAIIARRILLLKTSGCSKRKLMETYIFHPDSPNTLTLFAPCTYRQEKDSLLISGLYISGEE